jgi:hypothetical protein
MFCGYFFVVADAVLVLKKYTYARRNGQAGFSS